MPACANCRRAHDVRLFELSLDGRTLRRWWCPECAYHWVHEGFWPHLVPEWIERAALRQLPVKELPAPDARPVRSPEIVPTSHDRRRGERRRQRVS